MSTWKRRESRSFSCDHSVYLHRPVSPKFRYGWWEFKLRHPDDPTRISVMMTFNCDAVCHPDLYHDLKQQLATVSDVQLSERNHVYDWIGQMTPGAAFGRAQQSGHVDIIRDASSQHSRALFDAIDVITECNLESDNDSWCLTMPAEPTRFLGFFQRNNQLAEEVDQQSSGISPVHSTNHSSAHPRSTIHTASKGSECQYEDDYASSLYPHQDTDEYINLAFKFGCHKRDRPERFESYNMHPWDRRVIRLNIHVSPINQSTNQSTDQSTDQSTNQPATREFSHLTNTITDRLREFRQSFFDRRNGFMVTQSTLNEPDYRWSPVHCNYVYQEEFHTESDIVKLWYQRTSSPSEADVKRARFASEARSTRLPINDAAYWAGFWDKDVKRKTEGSWRR